jgi:hypothetical protein
MAVALLRTHPQQPSVHVTPTTAEPRAASFSSPVEGTVEVAGDTTRPRPSTVFPRIESHRIADESDLESPKQHPSDGHSLCLELIIGGVAAGKDGHGGA